MIKYLPSKPQKEFIDICSKDAVGCEIISDFALYGENSHIYDSFFWMQDENMALYKKGGLLRLSGNITDIDELTSFIKFTGAKYILSSENLASKLPYEVIEKGEILYFKNNGEEDINISTEEEALALSLTDFFYKEGMIKNKESFLSDFSFAIYKNSALFSVLKGENGNLTAVALTTKINSNSAVIDLIAVNKEQRRKGLGTIVTKALISKLNNKTIYIFKEKDKNTEFYHSLNFKYMEDFVTLKVF